MKKIIEKILRGFFAVLFSVFIAGTGIAVPAVQITMHAGGTSAGL